MDLFKLLESMESTFSGTLDDTLLNRLATALQCENTNNHSVFWKITENYDVKHLLEKCTRQLIHSIKAGTLCHPNLLKIFFALLKHFPELLSSNENMQESAKSLIRECLQLSTCPEIQLIIIECCLILVEKVDNTCGQLSNILIDDNILHHVIGYYISNNSIFSRDTCVKLISQYMQRCILEVGVFRQSCLELSKLCGSMSTLGLEVLAAYSEVCKLNDMECDFSSLCTYDALMTTFATAPDGDVKAFAFYVLYLSLDSHEYLVDKLKLEFAKLSSEIQVNLTLRLLRRLKHSGIVIDLRRNSLAEHILVLLGSMLARCVRCCDIKVYKRLKSVLSDENLSQLLSEADSTELALDIIGRCSEYPSSISFLSLIPRLPLANGQLLKMLHSVIDMLNSGKLCDQMEFSTFIKELFLTFWHRRGRFAEAELSAITLQLLGKCESLSIEESAKMSAPGFSFCFTGIIIELFGSCKLETLSPADFRCLSCVSVGQLIICQKNALNVYKRRNELTMLSCHFLDAALCVFSSMFTRRDFVRSAVGDDMLKELLSLSDIIVNEECMSGELREKVLAVLIYFCVLFPENLDTIDKVCSTLASNPLDYRSVILSKTISQCITKESGELQMITLHSVLSKLLDGQMLVADCLDPACLLRLKCWSERMSKELGEEMNSALGRLEALLAVPLKCSDCGEVIDDIVSDILIAQEMPTNIDCVGD